MITEIVTFDLPNGMATDAAVALYEQTVERWKANPALVRKYYLLDGEADIGGGVYHWHSRADAEAAHDAAWCDGAEAMYGTRPRFQYFETPLVVEGGGA